MTIAVCVRTSTAVVFAADSRLTTYGRAGFDPAGTPIVLPQTYENATKIVMDSSKSAMAVVTGSATLGSMSFMDYIAASAVPSGPDPDAHDKAIQEFVEGMQKLREAYWNEVPEEQWPVTVLMLAATTSYSSIPTVWRITFMGKEIDVHHIQTPVYLEGSYRSAFTLLYGYDGDLLSALANELKVGEQVVGPEAVIDAMSKLKVLRPIDRLLLNVMPIQDAMEFAFLLATTQIQMERFLPGEAACGGPVDLMVLMGTPTHEIMWYPGSPCTTPVHGKLGCGMRRTAHA